MREKVLVTPTSSWPAGVPFFDLAPEPNASRSAEPLRQASVSPIELRINGGDGPSAIAILE